MEPIILSNRYTYIILVFIVGYGRRLGIVGIVHGIGTITQDGGMYIIAGSMTDITCIVIIIIVIIIALSIVGIIRDHIITTCTTPYITVIMQNDIRTVLSSIEIPV
jgi:hypothetical protein